MIYQRYLFKEIAKYFSLILFSLFVFFVLAHLTAELKLFNQPEIRYYHVFLYQLAAFGSYLPLVTPPVLSLAAVKVYTSLAKERELVALTTGGISKKALLRPLLLFSLLVMTLLYLFMESAFPAGNQWLETFSLTHFRKQAEKSVSYLHLPHDHSEMIYKSYHPQSESLNDVYWLKSPQEIWHFKTINLLSQVGFCVDQLQKKEEGWKLVKSLESYAGIPIKLNEHALVTQLLPVESQRLSMLFHQAHITTKKVANREAKLTTHFYRNISLPLASIFAVILPASYCLQLKRDLPLILYFFWALTGGVSYLILVNVSCILGSAQLLPPLVAMGLLPLIMTIWSATTYARLQ